MFQLGKGASYRRGWRGTTGPENSHKIQCKRFAETRALYANESREDIEAVKEALTMLGVDARRGPAPRRHEDINRH